MANETDRLNAPDIDVSNDPLPHAPAAGDWNDDDALAYDELFEENSDPAFATAPTRDYQNLDPEENVIPTANYLRLNRVPVFSPGATNRPGLNLPSWALLYNGYLPGVMLFPGQPTRKELIISSDFPFGIVIAPEPSLLNQGTLIRGMTFQSTTDQATTVSTSFQTYEWRTNTYTGPVWVWAAPPDIPAALTIESGKYPFNYTSETYYVNGWAVVD